MKERLIKLLDNSYSEYSQFKVASIIVTTSGEEIEGVNYESASYGGTICAERNAIGTAIAQGAKRGDLKEVHIIGQNKDGKYVPATPCGICRQMIAEQSNNNAKVFLYTDEGMVEETTIDKLLPNAFLGELL